MPVRPVIPASLEQLAAWHADPGSGDAVAMQAMLQQSDALQACLRQQRVPAILDLHFGAGLAFLLSWQAYAEYAAAENAAERLHYVAIMEYPCTVDQLAHAQARWPQLASYAQALRQAWPMLLPGTHRLVLDGGRVILTLIFGTQEEELVRLEGGIDLFYLHGQPQRFNQAVPAWTAQSVKRLARLAWTGAQAVVIEGDAGLVAAMRQSGFVATAVAGGQALHLRYAPGWARPPSHVASSDTPQRRELPHARHALVIGAGLAGSAVAERLAARGWRIDLVEAEAAPAQRTSGNLGGLFMPALARDDSPLARLTRAAFLFAGQHWQRLGGVALDRDAHDGIVGELCGILQFGRDAKQALSFEQGAAEWKYPGDYARWMSATESQALLGMPTMGGGYFFPQAGWLNPPSVCRRQLAVAAAGGLLDTQYGLAVASLQRDGGTWTALDQAGNAIASAPVVILAAGAQAGKLAQSATLPLNAVRGQVTHLDARDFPELPVALCGDGYLTRPYAGQLCMGASYDRDEDLGLRAASHAENLERLRHMLPGITAGWVPPSPDDQALQGRVGLRSIAPDRLPLAGALPGHPGLHVVLGYASRGLIWAPLMAELLAARLEGEPLPLPRELVQAVDPGRFQSDLSQ